MDEDTLREGKATVITASTMGERSGEVEGTFLLYVMLGVDETEGHASHLASV
jgi:hypothetical protein